LVKLKTSCTWLPGGKEGNIPGYLGGGEHFDVLNAAGLGEATLGVILPVSAPGGMLVEDERVADGEGVPGGLDVFPARVFGRWLVGGSAGARTEKNDLGPAFLVRNAG
jgi:hypothetical protein